MLIVGITGGIASGKSTFTGRLVSLLGSEFFDADHEAKQLFENEEVVKKIALVFGDSVLDHHDQLDRKRIRQLVFSDEGKRRQLENILHPRIREKWMQIARNYRKSDLSGAYIVDIPLLFETDAQDEFDIIICIACSYNKQIERLTGLRGLDLKTADQMVKSQLPLPEKIHRSHCVIWNNGSLELLDEQANLTAKYLKDKDV